MELTFATAYRQLKPAEKAFVDDYVSDMESAAIRSGERLSNMLLRPLFIDDDARGFLDRSLVRAAIAERVRDLSDMRELSAHRAIKELAAIAFSSIAHYMEVGENGQPYFDMTKATPEQLSAIASIEIEDNPRGARKFKFKLHDKLGALQSVLKHMGLLETDNPVWREYNARPINDDQQRALPASVTPDQAQDMYARMING